MNDVRPLERDDGGRSLRRAMTATALGFLVALVAKILVWPPEDPEEIWITWYLFRQQDAPMLVLGALLLFMLPFAPKIGLPGFPSPGAHFRLVVLVAAAVFVCGAIGRIYLHEGFDLSRDEFMAVFDAKIFASGHLFASLPLEWRPFADALQPQFMAPLKGGEQMVSGYLPVNAMLRAGVGALANPVLMNPLLAAGSVLLVHSLARDLWPSRPDAALCAARGRFLVMGDADGSYDFRQSLDLVRRLTEGADLCMGSRFKGGIEPGAMPWKNRYIGNPALTFVLNLFYGAGVGDAHCGLRALTRSCFQTIGLTGAGMEFASEMIIKASLKGMRIEEAPVTLSRDLRDRAPHLRPWRDGWRHLRYLFMLSPVWAFAAPAGLAALAGDQMVTDNP